MYECTQTQTWSGPLFSIGLSSSSYRPYIPNSRKPVDPAYNTSSIPLLQSHRGRLRWLCSCGDFNLLAGRACKTDRSYRRAKNGDDGAEWSGQSQKPRQRARSDGVSLPHETGSWARSCGILQCYSVITPSRMATSFPSYSMPPRWLSVVQCPSLSGVGSESDDDEESCRTR